MNDFDQAARYTAKLDPPGFLRWLLPRLRTDLIFRGWLDTRRLPFPGEKDRICDTVAAFANAAAPDDPWAVIVEFQSEPEGIMPARLADYEGRLFLEHKGSYRVASAVVNLTGPPQSDTLDMRLPGMEEYGTFRRIVTRTMRDEDAAATLAGVAGGQIARCILPFIPLMHRGSEPAIITQWQQVAGTEPDPLRRSQYGWLALVFADLAGCLSLWRQALMGWNMRQSVVVNEVRAEVLREQIQRALELRFRTAVPADLVTALTAVTDLGELFRWFDASQTANSLDEFRAAVGQ